MKTKELTEVQRYWALDTLKNIKFELQENLMPKYSIDKKDVVVEEILASIAFIRQCIKSDKDKGDL